MNTLINAMAKYPNKRIFIICRKLTALVVALTFFVFSLGPIPKVFAQTPLNLPAPGVMVTLSNAFTPPLLKGVIVHPENPFKFNFIIDTGDAPLKGGALKEESTKLIKYFLASLTTPEKDLWVNLSPYEKDRIIPREFGSTEMG